MKNAIDILDDIDQIPFKWQKHAFSTPFQL